MKERDKSVFNLYGKCLRRTLRPSLLLLAISLMASGLTANSSVAAPKVHLGVIGYSGADATLNATAKIVQEQAKALGWDVSYAAAQPAGDIANANLLMQTMLTNGATVLMTMAFDANTLSTGMAAAIAANVPVFAMSAGTLAPGVMWASNVGYIPAMGKLIEKDLRNKEGKVKAEILNLTYLQATPGQGRNKLIQEVAERNPGIRLTNKAVAIPGAVNSGRDSTVAWLARNPPKKGIQLAIYAVFDQPASGAVIALKQAKRKDVKIYSYDATLEGLAMITAGYIFGNVQNGRLAQATQAINAVKANLAGTLTAPILVPAAYFIVTPKNISKYASDFPSAFTSEGI
jgi:ribose transport system substrate-binding protein